QIAQFGRIPVIYRGRIKPLDTLARNSLRAVSNREEFTTADGRRQPAIRWLLDVITDADIAREHRVFRIDNLEVLNLLGLQRRPGSLYSIDEIAPQIASFEREVLAARQVARDAGPEKLSVYQKKLVELDGRLRTFTLLSEAFVPPVLPPLPTREEVQRDEEAARAKAEVFRERYRQFLASIQARETPLAVPQPTSRQEPSQVQWLPYSQAWAISFIDASLLGLEPAEALQRLNTILVAYRQQDVPRFNAEVDGYLRFLQQHSPAEYAGAPVDFEARFNHFAPFYQCAVLYLFVFVLTALAWLTAPLGGQRPLNWAAFALVLLIFAVHTYAIVARIHISGRPPVTNLYGSAIFIGWGCVLLGLILEWIFRLGVGNMVAAVSGFATLLVAHFLADGDTLAVLQAVLDTQFWLATHVVTVTLGYATTYVAGLLGIFYILGSVVQRLGRPALQAQVGTATVGKLLATMIYGTLCFSIFFSFVGTVLGGLWADDSWGRFWGWDPKENGALIIVLWNALVLHARWGGMVKDRGLAMLAVAGNIAVSWSYFGVNELGIGLHSYGFTEGVLKWLGIFVASQLLLILLGWLAQLRWFGPRPAR
ncbi:MAG: cytochrome C biogenesis protein, partial [Planctomycetales bacterium]|nr:cytochrome C biogenesis protein [Planctomycetales bacterium]